MREQSDTTRNRQFKLNRLKKLGKVAEAWKSYTDEFEGSSHELDEAIEQVNSSLENLQATILELG